MNESATRQTQSGSQGRFLSAQWLPGDAFAAGALCLLPAALIGIQSGYLIQKQFDGATFIRMCRGRLFVSGCLLVAKGVMD